MGHRCTPSSGLRWPGLHAPGQRAADMAPETVTIFQNFMEKIRTGMNVKVVYVKIIFYC